MATFHIYVDESGKLAMPQTDWTCLCGYVGHVTEWNRVSQEWANCRMKWQVPPIHMARIMNPTKKNDSWKTVYDSWGSNWDSKRDAMLDDFADIIRFSSVACIGAIVDANAYRKVKADPTCILTPDDSNVYAFHNVIMRGIEKIEVVDRFSPVSIVVDDDPQNISNYYQLLQNLREHPDARFTKVKERIQGICFCEDSHYPGLQAADMVAYESRKCIRESAKDAKVEPSLLLAKLTFGGMHVPQVWSADAIHTVASNTYKIVNGLMEPRDHGKAKV